MISFVSINYQLTEWMSFLVKTLPILEVVNEPINGTAKLQQKYLFVNNVVNKRIV